MAIGVVAMKIQRRVWLLTLLMAVSATTLLYAQDAGDVVVKRGSIADDLYVAGRSVDVAAQVRGDVVAAGRLVSISDSVSGDVLVAGESITIHAQVLDDVRAAGRSVTVSGSVAGHVVAAGETVVIAPAASTAGWAWLAGREVNVAGRVGKSLKVAAQTVIISGEVAGDVELLAEEILIPASARIHGNLVYHSDMVPQIAEGAEIAGDIIAKPLPYREPQGRGAGLVIIAAQAVAGIAFFLLFPAFSITVVDSLRQNPLSALGIGFAFLFATPFIILLLLITVVGVLVALPLLAWYLVSLLGGFLGAVIFVGDSGLRILGKAGSAGKGIRVLSIVFALIALLLLQMIPAFGGLALFALFLLGLGALQLQVWRAYSKNRRSSID
jgi:cytoskeletal protein CcmA (bactofilin family)